jgi:sugar phosphate isomerase/epimerase
MRFGCCGGLDKIQIVQDAGYDYIEMSVAAVMAESPDEEFESTLGLVKSFDIVPEAWNCLLPGDFKVTGPEIDMYRVERYLRTAFARIEDLGGEIVVFGSGGARRVPDSFSMEEAGGQIVEFLTLAGRIAGAHGITIAVEPLHKRGANIINSVTDALAVTRAVDHPFVKVLADLYHMQEENEPLSHIIDAGNELAHVHTADTGRLYPGSGSYPNAELIEALRSIGYNDRISVECSIRDWDTEPAKALEFLRTLDREIEI